MIPNILGEFPPVQKPNIFTIDDTLAKLSQPTGVASIIKIPIAVVTKDSGI